MIWSDNTWKQGALETHAMSLPYFKVYAELIERIWWHDWAVIWIAWTFRTEKNIPFVVLVPVFGENDDYTQKQCTFCLSCELGVNDRVFKLQLQHIENFLTPLYFFLLPWKYRTRAIGNEQVERSSVHLFTGPDEAEAENSWRRLGSSNMWESKTSITHEAMLETLKHVGRCGSVEHRIGGCVRVKLMYFVVIISYGKDTRKRTTFYA